MLNKLMNKILGQMAAIHTGHQQPAQVPDRNPHQ